MKKTINLGLLLAVFFVTVCSNVLQAQTPANSDQVYIVKEFMKVEPGMEADYLKTEQLWKKVHQRRVDEGKIISWSLTRRAFSGTNSPYDYVLFTAYKSGKEMDEANSSMTWDYITKGMTAEELVIANNTLKTRKMVSSQLLMGLNRVQPLFNNRYMKITQVKAAPGKGDELEKLETMMKPVFEEACKMGNVTGWRFGKNLYPQAAGAANYYRAIATSNMDDMLKSESGDFLATAFKKIYPAKDWKAIQKNFSDIITIMDTELLEVVDATKAK